MMGSLMHIASLIGILTLSAAGVWMTYDGAMRSSRFFLPAAAALGAAASLLWFVSIRGMSRQNVYAYSLAWDAVVLATYYLLPLVAFQVRLSLAGAVGLALVVVGCVLVKVSANGG